MMPPTSIDGTDITGATIDGTDVTEITVDGDTVFTSLTSQASHIFDADALSLSDGDPVNIFPDSVGSVDFDVTTNAPEYNDNGINGLGTVEARSGQFLKTDATGFGISSPFTIIAVAQLQSGADFQHLYEHDINTIQLRTNNSGDFQVKLSGDSINFAPSDFDPHIFTVDFDTTLSVFLDGTNAGSDSVGTAEDLDQLSLFIRPSNDLPGDWDLGELRIFDDVLSSSERQAEESDLSAKWGITI